MRSSGVLLAPLVLVGLAVSGCAISHPHRWQAMAEHGGAVVYGVHSPLPRPPVVQIDAIDSRRVAASSRTDAHVVEPGARVLAVTGSCFRGWLMDIGTAELRVTLEAGRAYEILVAPADGGLKFSLRDAASQLVVSSQVSAVTHTLFMPQSPETLSLR